MTKNEIIEKWFRENVVQDIVRKVTDGKQDAKYDDLISIVYMYLLQKPEELIQELYQNGQYKYFISKMVMLQLTSTRSKHYYHIRRFSAHSSEYDLNKPATDDDKGEIEKIYELIDLLPDDEKEVIRLYDFYGNRKEVTKHLGLSDFIVKKKLNNAFRKLKYAYVMYNNKADNYS